MDKNRLIYRGKPKNERDFEFFKKLSPDNVDNSFVYGTPAKDDKNKVFICPSTIQIGGFSCNNGVSTLIEVIPETVGQCTEMIEDTDTMIFENDILRWNANLYLVSYIQGGFVCTEAHDKKPTHFRTLNALVNFRDPEEIVEVVGNKFDNPELLSREEMTKQVLEKIEMIKKQRNVQNENKKND